MSEVVQPLQAPVRPALWRNGLLVVGALVVVGVILRSTDPQRVAGLQNFFLVFGSLLIEAVPFILLGALVSAAIEVFVPGRVFEKLALLPKPLQLPASGIAGFAFPVCECGSVPVARRLAAKGLSPAAAVTFMLAAPIFNPVVLTATAVAYRGRESMWTMVLGRAALGLIVAIAVGWVVGARKGGGLLKLDVHDDHEHSHENDSPKWMQFFGHIADDFFFMGRYLVLGATVAATMQTVVPQTFLSDVAGTPVLDVIALMGLAFILSLCSESDAFVAASFVQFGVGAQLGFLVFGPMMDTKLGFLYAATFKKGFLPTVLVTVATVTLAGTLWIEVIT